MSKHYDVVIIGTGAAANVAAARAKAANRAVAVIDSRPFGGTCALRGCDPKKLLRSGAEVVDHVRRMQGKGVVGDVGIAWPLLMAFKRSFTDPIPSKREKNFSEKGIATYHGTAKFVGPDAVRVGDETLHAKHVLIATGARPIELGIPGEEHLVTSERFLSWEALPPRIAFVGGGYIAAELSHLAARAASNVTILQRGPRMLPRFEPELVDLLMNKFRAERIDVRTETSVTAVSVADKGFIVHASSRGRAVTLEADLVVHAAGRVPALRELELERGGIETRDGRLVLNEFLQSASNPIVYAAGDAAHVGPPLTPVSSYDAKVAVTNMIEGNKVEPDYAAVPSVAFTIPPIAKVGMSEATAREKGLVFRVETTKASEWFTAIQTAEPTYGSKVLVDETTDLVLGAHLVGPNVDELINLFALAIRHRIKAKDLESTIFAYPTGASDVGYMLPGHS
jgi:glutathione reductase (NADPH)